MARSRTRNFEDTKKDKMEDRRQARKAKMTMTAWENSPGDDDKGYASGGKVRGMGAATKGGKYRIS